ncbi:MAG: cation diffusion facilitator family transporter [Thalassobaculum sp.]
MGDATALDPIGQAPQVARLTRRAAVAASAVAAVLVVAKTGAWWTTDSVAMLSSLVDSLLDAGMSLVTLLAVHKAAKPADREHRWGHGKAESVAALSQAAFIGGSAALVLVECARRLIDPAPIRHEWVGILTTVFAILLSLALVAMQSYVIRRTRSTAITADRAHYSADLVVNAGVIGSLLIAGLGGWTWVDPVIAGVIAAWMGRSAWRIGREAVDLLMDRELPDDERNRIRRIALEHPDVKAVRDLRTRRSGTDTFVQMILVVDGALSVNQAHRIVDTVEAAVCAAYPSVEVLIHEEPEQLPEERSTARRPGSRHGDV